MSGEITITPGKTWADGEAVTYDKLNQGARPTAQLNAGSVTAREIDAASVAGALENIASVRNHFRDPLFDQDWLAPTGRTMTQATGEAFNHPGWYVVPAAGQCDYSRAAEAPTGSTGSGYALKVTGHATCTGAVRIGQQVRPAMAAALAGEFVVSFYVKNMTDAAMTPVARVWANATLEDWSTAAVAASVTAESTANTEWTRVTAAFDMTGVADWAKGGAVEIEIPEGSLDDPGKYVLVAQPLLEGGTVASTWVPPNGAPLARFVQAGNAATPTSVTPAVTNDWTEGYQRGDLWHDLGTGRTWVCRSADPAGAADWALVMPLYVPPKEALYEGVMLASEGTSVTLGAATWTTVRLDTEVYDDTGSISVASNELTFAEAGTYEIVGEFTVRQTTNNAYVGARLYNETTDAVLRLGDAHLVNANVNLRVAVRWRGTLAAADVVKLQGYSSAATSTVGEHTVNTGADYVIARLHVRKIS